MPYARLLLGPVLLSAVLVVAQDLQPRGPETLDKIVVSPGVKSTPTAPEPWKIFPAQQQEAPPLHWLTSEDAQKLFRFPTFEKPPELVVDGQPMDASICYSIRSYVVARDDKDSDSTHLVRSSTCQPARRYGLKKAQARPDPSNQ